MIKLPFTIGPGVAKRWVTEAGYIDGSFIICDNFDDLRDLLDTSKYRLQAGTPILVNDYDKIYKYVEGENDISKLPHFDFFTDKLDPGTIYAWKAGAWYNLSEIFLHLATKEDLENLKKDLQNEFNRKYTELSNALNKEIDDRENADLLLKQEIQTQLNTFQNNITNLEISLNNEVSRAEQAEQKLQEKIEEETERAITAESTLSQKVDDALADLGGQYDDLFGDFNNFKQEYKTDQEEVDSRLDSLRDDLDNEITRSKDETNKLQDQIAEEVKRATAAEQANQQMIIDEMQVRAAQDSRMDKNISDLQSKLDQEISDRASADGSLQSSLNNEIERATGVEKDLQDQIDNLSTKVEDNQKQNQEAIDGLQEQLGEGFSAEKTVAGEIGRLEEELNTNTSDLEQKIKDEATTREKNDTALNNSIQGIQDQIGEGFDAENTVAKRFEDVEANSQDLSDKLNQEITDRENADSTLQSTLQAAIDAEAKARGDKDTELEKAITAEQTRATQAEKDIQDQIGEGFSAEKTVQSEIERLEGDITTNASDIEAEQKRATAAEQANAKAISDETTRATNAEENLQKQLGEGFDETNTVASAIESAKKEASDAITAEQSRAEKAETDLGKRIDDLADSSSQDIENLQTALDEEIARAKQAESEKVDIEGGELKDTIVTFDEATIAGEITSGETTGEIVGKIKKSISDLSGLKDDIIAERNRATAAEQANKNAIEAEVTRATTVEGDLTTLTTTNKTSLVAAINEESARAKAAEKKNTDAINSEIERAKGVENQLNEQITDATSSLNSIIETTKQDLEEEIQTSASEHTKINQRLDTIESKIPTQASPTNQLADKAFVNSSIQANAARFLTPTAEGDSQWDSFDKLKAGPWFYEGKDTTPTNNDYAVFLKSESESESGAEEQWRALFQKSDGEVGTWVEQYKMGSAFTNAQQEAIDSGITKSLTAQINTNKTDITNLQTSLQDHIKDTADKYVTKIDPTFSGTMTPEVGSKIDFSQSTTNVRTPVANNEAANKKYVDDALTTNSSSTLTSANEYTDDAIEGLDSSITEEENKYISSITQTNGKITGNKKTLPVTNIKGTDPIGVSNDGSIYTITHKEKSVTNSSSTGATTFVTEVSADSTGHLSNYKTNTFENALKALGVINIFGGTATDLI